MFVCQVSRIKKEELIDIEHFSSNFIAGISASFCKLLLMALSVFYFNSGLMLIQRTAKIRADVLHAVSP